MNAITTSELPATDTEPKRIRAHMDGRPDEVLNSNGKFSPLENHQEAARLLLSRMINVPKEACRKVGWHSQPLTGGKMVHVYADPRRAL